MNFEPIETYRIDPTDKTTVGRLLHAAKAGDQRAKLTLRHMDKLAAAKSVPVDTSRADDTSEPSRVSQGRELRRASRGDSFTE